MRTRNNISAALVLALSSTPLAAPAIIGGTAIVMSMSVGCASTGPTDPTPGHDEGCSDEFPDSRSGGLCCKPGKSGQPQECSLGNDPPKPPPPAPQDADEDEDKPAPVPAASFDANAC